MYWCNPRSQATSAIKGLEALDKCLGKLATYVNNRNGILFITADHGNAEEMINLKTGAISTEHSDNPVPFIVAFKKYEGKAQMLPTGILADIAPTILSYLGIEIPGSMMGRDLLSEFKRNLS